MSHTSDTWAQSSRQATSEELAVAAALAGAALPGEEPLTRLDGDQLAWAQAAAERGTAAAGPFPAGARRIQLKTAGRSSGKGVDGPGRG